MHDFRADLRKVRDLRDEAQVEGIGSVIGRLGRQGLRRLYVEVRLLLQKSAPFVLVPAAVVGLIALLAGLPFGAGLVLVGLIMFVLGVAQAFGGIRRHRSGADGWTPCAAHLRAHGPELVRERLARGASDALATAARAGRPAVRQADDRRGNPGCSGDCNQHPVWTDQLRRKWENDDRASRSISTPAFFGFRSTN